MREEGMLKRATMSLMFASVVAIAPLAAKRGGMGMGRKGG
jgi:hypothetical protein